MEKDKILTMSRNENKQKDLFGREVLKEGGYIGAITALVLATIFFMAQIFAGGGANYGLYAIVLSFSAVAHIVRAFRVKHLFSIVLAAAYTILVLILSIVHIHGLLTVSSVL